MKLKRNSVVIPEDILPLLNDLVHGNSLDEIAIKDLLKEYNRKDD